ncbi:hypothetical protein D3Y59_06130 [Hymenobacter oligotrophus]|uniref:Glycosyltransferase RgtA/B/C/D-like domain-containing protein n=1 Tax=Hymenobacter oligotrophus TaxID=2319843 RepID=A0A3B7R036_9BACT|nr:hypothetical protein [Hymenobacter oligotrophus]AYA36670.1 hypothetical protein D3Y59_06130 [Hymenobacter oligotrophus]
MLPHILHLSERQRRGLPVLVALLLYLGYLPFSGYDQLHHDALLYWYIAVEFLEPGHRFNFLAFDNSLRGYLWPLLLLPARVVAFFSGVSPIVFTRLIGALIAALLFGWAVPAVWRRYRPGSRQTLATQLLFVALGFAFWRDYFNFPLTDFPALLALLAALWCLLPPTPRGWQVVAAGALLGASLNLRSVYAIALPAVLVLVGVSAVGWRTRVVRLALLMLGLGAVLGPQLWLNVRHFNAYTPLVLTRYNPFDKHDALIDKLGWSLAVQKYETNIGPQHHAAQVLYFDPDGQALLRHLGQTEFATLGAYLQAISRHPATVAGIYARHLISGFDVKYPTPYLQELRPMRWGYRAANFGLLALGVAVLGLAALRGKFSLRQALVLLAVSLPCLAAVPTAMECRYLMPWHLLLLGALCFEGQHLLHWLRGNPRRWPVLVAAVLLVVGLALGFVWQLERNLAQPGELITG